MERLKPKWIEVDTGYGDSKLIVGVNSWHKFEVGSFLNWVALLLFCRTRKGEKMMSKKEETRR
ncbi:hypothetical protein [Segetibacter aerophilus]|uniref:Uncharacterized protein n=1 Tax=Segetibacter aerophilus TaxID=670293 RepID=A0A512BEV0_9BACT|nr:hypothetical protein [Segetibacter aerophilus]GEO10478.1 hypothetical protein SAE01_29740 [Segetibacter aerophilus]